MGRPVRAARLLLPVSSLWSGLLVALPSAASPCVQAVPAPATARPAADAAVGFDEAKVRAAAEKIDPEVDYWVVESHDSVDEPRSCSSEQEPKGEQT